MEGKGLAAGNYDDILENIGLDLFSKEPYDSSISSFSDVRNRLIHPITDEGPYEFLIGGSSSSPYLLLPHTRLVGTIGIRKNNGKKLDKESKISVVNLFPHTLFDRVTVMLNDTPVSNVQFYPYISYIQTQFSHSENTKSNILRTELHLKDEPYAYDADITSEGWLRKREWIGKEWFQFSIPIHADLFNCYKLLPGDVKLGINFFRSKDRFSLLHLENNTPSISFKELTLVTRHVFPSQSVITNHQRLLSVGKKIILPITRGVVKKYPIQQGSYNIELGRICSGVLPRQIISFIVDNDRMEGSGMKSPFYFPDRHDRNAALIINGESFPR